MGNDKTGSDDRSWTLHSPDGALRMTVTLGRGGTLNYEVYKGAAPFLDKSTLGIVTGSENFTEGLTFTGFETTTIDETYSLPHGKRSVYVNRGSEMTIRFGKNGRELKLVCRAYDDGVAFRYELDGAGEMRVTAETTSFELPKTGLLNVWSQKFMKCYERTYDLAPPEWMDERDYAFPALLQVGGDGWMLLTEAGVYGEYCASHLIVDPGKPRSFSLGFAPDQTEPLKANAPLVTPWRTAIIGDDLAAIVESVLVFHLNPPSEVANMSWIKPGRSAWSWHSDSLSCRDQDKQKSFVDFASRMGWEYSLVDGGWDREESNVDIPELVRYAGERGVGIWLWSHYRKLEDEAECRAKLQLWAGWGVKGVKVDFFDSDAQDRIRVYDRIAREALACRLMINYHGSTKPSGEERRWPHVMTREGIFGAEYWKNDLNEGPNAVHNCTVPFTRNVVGAMDYTPVTLSRLTRTGHCHQLALAVIFESGVQNFADSIDAYEASAGLPFLQQVPAAWDETVLLEGYPGRFVTMARRSGQDWFVGAICAAGGRTARIPLRFLIDGASYEADIYEELFGQLDDYRFKHSTEITVRSERVTSGDTLSIPLRVNGGCVIRLKRR